MSSNDKSFRSKFNEWKKAEGVRGKFEVDRFVLLRFLDALAEVTDEFVFKGRVCLWHYIRTPRHTVDLDFTATLEMSHKEVLEKVSKAGTILPDISFSIERHAEVNSEKYQGMRIYLKYKSHDGVENKFHLDIVYALPTDLKKIKTPIGSQEIKAVTMENIIIDKVSACRKLKSGNTRMKDYDDLWRIADKNVLVDRKKLLKLSRDRGVELTLDK